MAALPSIQGLSFLSTERSFHMIDHDQLKIEEVGSPTPVSQSCPCLVQSVSSTIPRYTMQSTKMKIPQGLCDDKEGPTTRRIANVCFLVRSTWFFDNKVFEFYTPSSSLKPEKRADSSSTDHYLWANCIRQDRLFRKDWFFLDLTNANGILKFKESSEFFLRTGSAFAWNAFFLRILGRMLLWVSGR